MIIRTAKDVEGTPRAASGPGWRSARLIVEQDGLGYSVHETVVLEGSELHLEYKNHFETNYCYAGEGEVVDLATGVTHALRPGTLYALDRHDAHILRATRGDLRLVCVFNPPLAGDETHDASGSYGPRE
ncbi:ectoine synthase [Castellaniella sp.]|uniref:ectoine synthase n=1 Tax=Castellaniella sp. TaxID=1955812 RepID=UPI003560CD62